MIKECTNWVALKVDVKGEEVTLSVHEHRESCTSFYDRKGHEDYYGHGYDQMDNVLYSYGYWCSVFDPKTLPDNQLEPENGLSMTEKVICPTNSYESKQYV